MRRRDIIIGIIILIVLITGVIVINNLRAKKLLVIPTPTPSISQKINNTFPNLNIPEGTEQAELKDATGGESFGIATRTEIIANLPEPKAGQSYQGWLENSAGNEVLLGTLKQSKGGWILEYNSSRYPGYNKVIVTVGGNDILVGSF